jgi:hypothetical protein
MWAARRRKERPTPAGGVRLWRASPRSHRGSDLGPERGELDDPPHAHLPGRVDHACLVLDLARLVRAREEDAVHAVERGLHRPRIAEVPDRRLDMVAELRRGLARVPHEGTNGHAALKQFPDHPRPHVAGRPGHQYFLHHSPILSAWPFFRLGGMLRLKRKRLCGSCSSLSATSRSQSPGV